MNKLDSSGGRQLLRTWMDVLAEVLGEISGSPVRSEISPEAPADFPPAADTDVWILAACAGGLRGEMSVRIPSGSAVHLAQIFMSEPAEQGELSSERRDAVLELMRQAHGLFAAAVKLNWGEVQIQVESQTAAPSWPASLSGWFRYGEDSFPIWIEMHLSAAIVAAVRADQPAAAAPAAPVSAAASDQPKGKASLDLLMDVELGVALRFGSRRLLLREVLDLTPGSVIELDRQVHEPADMLLDGRVIARGEVVVIDGNFGLRVTEVAPPDAEHGSR